MVIMAIIMIPSRTVDDLKKLLNMEQSRKSMLPVCALYVILFAVCVSGSRWLSVLVIASAV